nr:hypothetical protein BaRGS_010593 [Batillaria attramentaria]
MWRILDMVTHKTDQYGDRFIDHGMIDLQRIERVGNMDSPRVLTTHLPLTSLPNQVKDKRTKIVHVYRNPKAVLVSMFFQQKTSIRMPDITLDKLDEMFCAEKGT